MTHTILVTAASSKTSRKVVERCERGGMHVRAVSRSTEIPFDWTDSKTWAPALANTDAAYIVIPPELAFADVSAILKDFVTLCEQYQLKHLVYLSGRGEDTSAEYEAPILSSVIPATVIRASWFAQNFESGFFYDAIKSGELVVPETNATEAFIDTTDIAEIVFNVFSQSINNSRHDNAIYEVTGGELLSFQDVAQIFTEKLNRTVQCIQVPLEAYLAEMKTMGLPEIEIELVGLLFGELLDGRNECTTNDVKKLLGREPTSFSHYVDGMVSTGLWNN